MFIFCTIDIYILSYSINILYYYVGTFFFLIFSFFPSKFYVCHCFFRVISIYIYAWQPLILCYHVHFDAMETIQK